MVTWQALPFLLILSQFMDTRATITLTSTVDGRQTACPGEVVTYTCTVTQAYLLDWFALPFIMRDNTNAPRFSFSTTENTVFDCSNSTSAVQCSEFDYRATLTDVSNAQNGFADMTSTFRFTASARVNGTVVECRAILDAGTSMSNSTLEVAGPPSPPRTPSFTIQQYRRDNVMLTVQWQSPQDDGGAPVDNYTVTVSPGLITLTTTTTNATVTIPYNVMHTVSIVATNCNGRSSAVMETNQAIVGCGSPSRPENGSVQSLNISQGTQEGSQIFFSCNTSYVPAGNMMSMCGSDGMWNPDPATFVCTFDCGCPESPRNGSVGSHPVTTEGSAVLYQCDQNLVPQELMRSVCTVSGWSPNPAEQVCNVVNCGIPNRPMNGSVEPPQSTLGGSVVEFGCDPGFIPADRMMTTCTLNGTWSPDPGIHVCNVSTINCGNPPTTAGGVTVRPSSTTTVSSVIYYQCQQSGFVPSSESSVCGEDGLWIPDPSHITCEMGPVTTASTGSPTATASTKLPTDPAVAQTGLSPGAIAGIIIVLLLFAVLVGAVVIVVFIWWRKRSDHVPKPEPQSDDVAMYSVVDDQYAEKPAYKGHMIKGPEAEYTTIDDTTSPKTSKQLVGPVYEEVNVKVKPSAKPHALKAAKADNPESDETVMHLNQAYETVTRMGHSRPVMEVPTKPCPAYGVVGAYH